MNEKIETTKMESVEITQKRRRSIGTSLSKFITRKIKRKSSSGQNRAKMVKIRSSTQMRRNTSVKSIDFWEEEYGATVRRRRSIKTAE